MAVGSYGNFRFGAGHAAIRGATCPMRLTLDRVAGLAVHSAVSASCGRRMHARSNNTGELPDAHRLN
jgi:hypothetical protein